MVKLQLLKLETLDDDNEFIQQWPGDPSLLLCTLSFNRRFERTIKVEEVLIPLSFWTEV